MPFANPPMVEGSIFGEVLLITHLGGSLRVCVIYCGLRGLWVLFMLYCCFEVVGVEVVVKDLVFFGFFCLTILV